MYLIGAASSAERGDDDRVVHRPGLLEDLLDLDDGGHALADRDVDADQVLVLVVDDRVDADRGLAGLAVADDQLALAATDRDHRVDRLEARLHRLLDRLALDDAGRLELGRARLGRVDVALVVERAAERVDEAAEQLVADRDLEQVAGALDRVALDDLVPLAEEHRADVVGSRLSARPMTSCGSSSISSDMQLSSPWIRGRCRPRPRARCRPRRGRRRRSRAPRSARAGSS